MRNLELPIDEATIRSLHIGDEVLLNGIIVTARDAAHKVMVTEKPKDLHPLLKDGAIYHCGPIVKKLGEKYQFTSAGPTTSIREEPFEADVIKEYCVRGIIGKGGMGKKTLEALNGFGAVYFHTVGGASAELARLVTEVIEVRRLDLGTPEAFWVVRVKDFPCTVTMDSHCNSLHDCIEAESKKVLDQLTGRV
jgi:fumarate hydratase subunit beta